MIFKGTRILVADVLELTQAGYTPAGVAEQYRGLLTAEAVREAVSLTRRRVVKEVVAKKTAA